MEGVRHIVKSKWPKLLLLDLSTFCMIKAQTSSTMRRCKSSYFSNHQDYKVYLSVFTHLLSLFKQGSKAKESINEAEEKVPNYFDIHLQKY